MANDDSKVKQPSARSSGSAARAIEKLAEARFLIDEAEAGDADAIAYVHAVLSQIGLPRSPSKERVWTRSNGGAHLTILAGGVIERGQRVEQPLPQGPYARLIMADICTYAVRYKTPVVPMEASVSAYMRNRLRLFPGGGKRGTYTSFKREAQALAAVHMELSAEYGGKRTHTKAPPIESFDAWVVDEGEQQALWPCELELSGKFFASLQTHAAPIDMRAYRALSHSALAQDIYTWLAHRLPRLKSQLGLPWAVLAEQFGGYSSTKKFREDFMLRLREVRAVYPDANVDVVAGRRGEMGGTLQIKPSRPPVGRVGVVLPGSIGARAEMGDQIPMDVQGSPSEAWLGSEASSTLEMHGPGRDAEASRDPDQHLRARVDQLRGWLQLVPKEHRQRETWEAELLMAERMLVERSRPR
jgi:hypothetical protein